VSDIYKEFGVDVLRDSENAGPTGTEVRMAQEIKRLRASNESLMNLVEEMQQEARRSFLLPTAMLAFSVILLIVVSFM